MAAAVDSQESAGAAHRGTTSGTALTWSFTNTAGNLLLLGVQLTNDLGDTPSITAGPTYGGDAMTLYTGSLVQWASANADQFRWYYLRNPKTGANTVSVTGTKVAGATNFAILAGAISFSGADIGTQVSTAVFTTQNTTAIAAAITTASGNFIVAGGGWGSGEGGTAGTGFTRTFLKIGSGFTAGDDILGEYDQSSGAAITPKFTWTAADQWGISAIEVVASAGGGSTPVVSTLASLGVGSA